MSETNSDNNNIRIYTSTGEYVPFTSNSATSLTITADSFTYNPGMALKVTSERLQIADEEMKNAIPEEMPKETSTVLLEDKGRIKVGTYKNGKRQRISSLIPAVRDIETPQDGKVVIVHFVDGTSEKAVLNINDTYIYDFDQGVSICLMKRFLSEYSDGNGSSVYNKLTKYGVDFYWKKREEETKKAEETAAKKKEEEKLKKKWEKKRARREAAKREREIEIQKEAYLRAMKEFNST